MQFFDVIPIRGDVYISSICRMDNFIYPPTIYTLYFDVLIFVCVRRIKCNKCRTEKHI